MPEIQVENVGRDDLVVSALPVLFSDELDEFVVDACSVGHPKRGSRGQIIEHDEVLFVGEASVIAFLGLFHHFLPHLQLLLIGEGNSVQSLKGIVFGIAQPVGSRVLGSGKRLDLSGVRNVGTTAQVDEITASVDGGAGSVRNLGAQDLDLERIVRKELEGLVLGDDHALELLFLFDDARDFFLDGFVIVVFDGIRSHVRIVIESRLEGRSDGELGTKEVLERLSHHVRRRVPKDGLGVLVIVELEELHSLDRSHQRAGHVPELGLHAVLLPALVVEV
mmetsp:Transcript_32718/g.77127  ORF Transcript_32718/g.77127 Transcript_32718/m.77127 type:complete len:278 (+) Transcript_32718:1152-1985(+)